ncbi:MAG TPA: hypothetical protein VHE35_19740 [Kofleriaceae bacterium]|nr:hypothetical protein [Kofleriaceae bacterium]
MPRQVREILGLLGAAQAAAVHVYPLHAGAVEAMGEPLDPEAMTRARAWASVWGADHGRLTAAITPAEKDALVAAGARELDSRD